MTIDEALRSAAPRGKFPETAAPPSPPVAVPGPSQAGGKASAASFPDPPQPEKSEAKFSDLPKAERSEARFSDLPTATVAQRAPFPETPSAPVPSSPAFTEVPAATGGGPSFPQVGGAGERPFPALGGAQGGQGPGVGELLAGLDKMNLYMGQVAASMQERAQRPADIGTPPLHREGTTQVFSWSDQEGFAAASPSTDHSNRAGLMGAGGTGPRDSVRFLEPGKRQMKSGAFR